MIPQGGKEGLKALMPRVLEYYGVTNLSGNFSSPWREDRDPSCRYYPDTHLVTDFGGGTVDVFGLVGKVEGLERFSDQVRRVEEITGASAGSVDPAPARARRPRFEMPERAGLGEDLLGACAAAHMRLMADEGAPGRAYLDRRGFGRDDRAGLGSRDALRYGLGFASSPHEISPAFRVREPDALGFLVIPYFEGPGEKAVHYAMLRTITREGAEPRSKEWRPKGARSPLFREWMAGAALDAVYLVEGLLDCLALEKMIARPVMALGGTSGTKRFGRVLYATPLERRPRRVVIAMDADDAGRRAADAIAADLDALGVPHSSMGWPAGCKDACDALEAEVFGDHGKRS